MSVLYDTALVEKSNRLNEMRAAGLNLQEIRFLCIYLSKINPYDKSTRTVRFPLSEYQRIMGFDSINAKQIDESTTKLLQKIIRIRTKTGGLEKYQLFSKFKIDKDDRGEWYVEAKAHDDMLDGLMFNNTENDFTRYGYFVYEVWNSLRLRSANQLRLYELLKQYEKIGERKILVSDLREMLGIAPNDYPRFVDFRKKVIDVCQKALKETTDICFEYERSVTGRGGKWIEIKFIIHKNKDYTHQLTFDEVYAATNTTAEDNVIIVDAADSSPGAPAPQLQQITAAEPTEQDEPEETSTYRDIDLYMEACDNTFTVAEVEALLSIIVTMNVPPARDGGIEIARFHYLAEKYADMKAHKAKSKIKYPYRYVRKIILKDREEQSQA